MRRVLLACLAMLALPGALAAVEAFEEEAQVPAGERATWPIEGARGDALLLAWEADAAVDVFVLRSSEAAALGAANATVEPRTAVLNESSGRAHVTLGEGGPWVLVVDNTDRPAGGAPGTGPANVTVTVRPYLLEVPPAAVAEDPSASQGDGREPPTLWNTLLFDSWSWKPGGVVGFGGVALWALVVLAVAMVGYGASTRTTALLTGAVTLFVTLWSLPRWPGAMTEIGLCAAAGLLVAWFAVHRVAASADALRCILVATIVGAFAGDVLAYALQHLWSDPGLLVFGNRRFVDEAFTVPGFAVLGFVLFRVIPDFVRAMEDDGEATAVAPAGPGQGEAFEVLCLRCRTTIHVDRSMKRFRVATDRFEFACPNCQYWMEWADPAQGAAAA